MASPPVRSDEGKSGCAGSTSGSEATTVASRPGSPDSSHGSHSGCIRIPCTGSQSPTNGIFPASLVQALLDASIESHPTPKYVEVMSESPQASSPAGSGLIILACDGGSADGHDSSGPKSEEGGSIGGGSGEEDGAMTIAVIPVDGMTCLTEPANDSESSGTLDDGNTPVLDLDGGGGSGSSGTVSMFIMTSSPVRSPEDGIQQSSLLSNLMAISGPSNQTPSSSSPDKCGPVSIKPNGSGQIPEQKQQVVPGAAPGRTASFSERARERARNLFRLLTSCGRHKKK